MSYKTDVSDMKNEKKNGLRPKLRFPGFTNAWEQRELSELADFSKGRGYSKGDLQESGTPIILYGRLYTKYETVISKVDTFVLEKEKSIFSKGNEVIVPSSGETAEDIARASVVENEGIILGGDLNIIKPNPIIDSAFLALTISSGEQQKELSKRAQGQSVVHLYISDLKEVKLSYPELAEQKRISSFFRKLDNLITLHQRKLAELQTWKKGLMQKIFPAEGESVPRLRFPGFTNAWEQRKLGDLLKTHPFRLYLADPSTDQSGGGVYEVIQQGDKPILGFSSGRPFENYQEIVLFGDHTVSLYKPENSFFIATDGVKILSGEGLTGHFLFSLLERYKPKPQGYKRHFSILKNENAWITENANEQAKIGQFFADLDSLITLHQRKLAELQTWKKGLMQQMFV